MKNIHILPTDKPSRLYKQVNKLKLRFIADSPIDSDISINQHIYITSDEEIKEGDWVIKISSLYKGGGITQKYSFIDAQFEDIIFKKIILTTDKSLDCVQPIDDEFLEWFVKNPNCEFVDLDTFSMGDKVLYNVVFSKEEPKQETLEQAAESYICSNKFESPEGHGMTEVKEAFIEGAKWQARRMEEILRKAYFSGILSTGEGWNGEYADGNDPNIEEKFSEGFTQWFEQFKKK
jgi:hypothetical protein